MSSSAEMVSDALSEQKLLKAVAAEAKVIEVVKFYAEKTEIEMDGMKKQISELKKLGLFALQKTQEAAPDKPQNDLNFVPQH